MLNERAQRPKSNEKKKPKIIIDIISIFFLFVKIIKTNYIFRSSISIPYICNDASYSVKIILVLYSVPIKYTWVLLRKKKKNE